MKKKSLAVVMALGLSAAMSMTAFAGTWEQSGENSIEGHYVGTKGWSDRNNNGQQDAGEEYQIYYYYDVTMVDENTISIYCDNFDGITTTYTKQAENVYGIPCSDDPANMDLITFDGDTLTETCNTYQMVQVFQK